MPLDFENVPIVLSQGLNTKSDPKSLAIGKMLSMTNCSFKEVNAITKRDGTVPLSQTIASGGSISNGVGIASFQDELLMLDGQNLYSYSSDLSTLITRGLLIPTSLAVQPVIRNTYQQTEPDSAFHAASGLKCFTWIDSSTSTGMYSVVDGTTGTVIVSPTAIGGIRLKVLTLGQYFIVIFYQQSILKTFQYLAIDTSNPTASISPVLLETTTLVNTGFDATIINNTMYLVFPTSTSDLVFTSLSTSLTQGPSFTVDSGVPAKTLCLYGDASNNVWCAYTETSNTGLGHVNVYATIVDPTLTSVLLAFTAVETSSPGGSVAPTNITMIVDGTTATIYYEIYGGADQSTNYIRQNTLTFSGTAGTPSTLIQRIGLASKAFIFGGTIYFLGVYGGDWISNPQGTALVSTSTEPTYFLINSSAQVILKLAPLLSGSFAKNGILSEVVSLSATEFQIAYLIEDDTSSLNGAIFFKTGVMSSSISFQIPYAMPKLVVGQNLHFAAGQLWAYDGFNIVEQGFHLYPENLVVSNFATSGGGIGSTLNNGTVTNQVQYKATYEWYDNQGQRHQSNPSPALTVSLLPKTTPTPISFTASPVQNSITMGSVSSFAGLIVGQTLVDSTTAGNLAAGTYIVALDPGASTITLSQPALNGGSGDTILTYDVCAITIQIPTLPVTLKQNVSLVLWRTENNQTIFYRVSSLTSLTLNSFTAPYVTIVDTLPDSAILGNEQLYTTGGTLGNINAPAVSAISTYQNRMVYLSPENPFQFGYSQQIIPGDPVEFNSLEFVQNIDQRIIESTAICPMDTELVMFGPNKKFFLTGVGPAPNGSSNDFSNPSPIAGISGCTNPNSVLEIPVGLVYQDIQKGFYLLDRSLAEHYIGADVEEFNGQAVTSCCLIPNATKCMFTLNSGVNLIYDYHVEQWETDPWSSGIEAVDSTLFEDDFIYIQPNGLALQQAPGTYTDNTEFIPIEFTTGDISLAQISGFQRVKELQLTGTYFSPHTLTVNIFTDYSATPTTVRVIPVLSPPPIYQFRIRLEVQKCTSLQIQVVESQSAPYGQGFSLSSMALRVGVKKGMNKLPAGESY